MFNTRTMNEDVYNAALVDGFTKIESLILSTRLTDPADVDAAIFYKSYEEPPLSSLKGSDKASKRIAQAIAKKEHIVLATDYDADGVTSAAIGHLGLISLGVEKEHLDVIVNEREHGNGINVAMIDTILAMHVRSKVDLVITADHGSADEERYKVLKKKGIDIVVTDHHEVPDGVPPSVSAFVNVKQDGCTFNRNISGATVLYYVIKATREHMKKDVDLDYLLPFVALTVISDQMSLRDPLNRQLFHTGLGMMERSERPPWSTFRKVTKIKTHFSETVIGFTIAPIINAANRMGNAKLSYKFLVADSIFDSTDLLMELVKLNNERKRLTATLRQEAAKQIINYRKIYDDSLIVVVQEGEGIIGVLAGIYSEQYRKPTGVFVKKPDGGFVGSFRSSVDIDLNEVFDKIAKKDPTIIARSGGHKRAAGVSVNNGKIKEFIKYFDTTVREIGYEESPYLIDLYINGEFIADGLFKATQKLAPYGNSWPAPIYGIVGTIEKMHGIGYNKMYTILHLMIDGHRQEFFVLNSSLLRGLKAGDQVDVAFTVRPDTFTIGKLSLTLDNIKRSGDVGK